MTKQERIQSDKRLQQLYTELIQRLKSTTTIVEEISEELDNNIQGKCAEKRTANSLEEALSDTTDWARIMLTAWKNRTEKDQEQ